MNYLVQVREVSEWGFYWGVKHALTGTRREAMRWARSYVPIYRRVRLEMFPSQERIEWRDGKQVTR